MNRNRRVEIGDVVEARIGACCHRATVEDAVELPVSGTRLLRVRTSSGQVATIPEHDVRFPLELAS